MVNTINDGASYSVWPDADIRLHFTIKIREIPFHLVWKLNSVAWRVGQSVLVSLITVFSFLFILVKFGSL